MHDHTHARSEIKRKNASDAAKIETQQSEGQPYLYTTLKLTTLLMFQTNFLCAQLKCMQVLGPSYSTFIASTDSLTAKIISDQLGMQVRGQFCSDHHYEKIVSYHQLMT